MSERVFVKVKAKCPGCGRMVHSTREVGQWQKSFECDKCHTRFSLTYQTDQADLERDFAKGKDIGKAARKIY